MVTTVTIFTAPKAFVGHIDVIQRNAIASWMRLRPAVDILLLGSDAGVAEVAAELGLRHIPDIQRNEFGTPLVNSIWETAEANSSSPWLMEVNCDIILTSEFLKLAAKLNHLPTGLYVGLRSDLDVTARVDVLDPKWEEKLIARVKSEGRYRGAGDDSFNGTDYYIYPRGLYKSIPAFAIGRFFWDSWLNAYVRRQGLPLVDVSAELPAIHQNHDYVHVKSANSIDMYRFWLNPEAKRNYELMGGFEDLFGPREASHKLVGDELAPTGKSLTEIRKANRRFYFPIALRASWFFRLPVMSTLWNYLFPYDSVTGMHVYARWGILHWLRGEVVRRVWKVFPSETRSAGHIIVREVRSRIPRRLPHHMAAGEARVSPVPAKASEEPATWPVQGAYSEPLCKWFLEHLPSSSGHRVIVPSELKGRIPSAFGFGTLNVNKHWRAIDLNIHHVVLSRKDVETIPITALRTICEGFAPVYRDRSYAIMSRSRVDEHFVCDEWPELSARLASDESAPTGDALAILNVWKRGPDLLRRQLQGLLEQTEPAAEIWVCAFGVTEPQAYASVVAEFADNNIYFLQSTKNFKYHGRFQMALSAETTYVAFIDDDIIIGRDFLRQSRIAIETLKDAGEVGIYGWRRLPGPGEPPQGPYADAERHDMSDSRIVHSTELGEWAGHLPHERSDMAAVEVDLLCGYHFLRASHVKLLFREQPWTFATGEDYQLAFALRKFAGMKSYVMPINPLDPDTWGLSPDWPNIRDEHATTVSNMLPVRDMLYWRLLNRGNSVTWMRDEHDKGTTYLFAAFSDVTDAAALYQAMADTVHFDAHLRVLALYCGANREDSAAAVAAFGLNVEDQYSHAWSWLDLEFGLEAFGSCADRTRASNAIYGIGALVDALKPASIWLVNGHDPGLFSAVQIACSGRNVEIVVVPAPGAPPAGGNADSLSASRTDMKTSPHELEITPLPAAARATERSRTRRHLHKEDTK